MYFFYVKRKKLFLQTMKIHLTHVFLLWMLSASAQIVNIESLRYTTDTTGWKGQANLGFTFGKQAERYYALNTGAHLQYKSPKSLYLILGNLDLLKSPSKDLVNSGFFHFRYNYKIKPWIRWEAFTQVQYNKLVGLRMRYLAGTGPRFKAVEVKKFKMYIGTLYLFEYEINSDRTEKLIQGRFSGYVSFSLRPIKEIEFVSTTYYQPRFDEIKDFRISTDNALAFKVYKNFHVIINYRMNLDTRPPKGATTNLIYTLENRFRLDF
jgi:hypothetical protein